MTLPLVSADELGVMPIDWTGLPTTYLNFGELEIIVALMRSVLPHTVVEIGLAQGRTALAVLREIPGIVRYVGIDTDAPAQAGGWQPKLASQWSERPLQPGFLAMTDPRFERLLRPRGSLDVTPADFPDPACAVFIDGDHSSDAVRHDSDLARAIVRPGGIVIWHDASNASVEVRRVLEEAAAAGHDIRQVEGTWLAFEHVSPVS